MRLEKLQQNEEVQGEIFLDNINRERYYFLDYINCGECYLLTRWINEQQVTVTLNKDTLLEDLCKKHGGYIRYYKLCGTTFLLYGSDKDRRVCSGDLDEVINRTEVDHSDGYYYTRLLKTLVTGEGLTRLSSTESIVRWANEGGSRGEDWYRLIKT